MQYTGPNCLFFNIVLFLNIYNIILDTARIVYYILQTLIKVFETQHEFDPNIFKQIHCFT